MCLYKYKWFQWLKRFFYISISPPHPIILYIKAELAFIHPHITSINIIEIQDNHQNIVGQWGYFDRNTNTIYIRLKKPDGTYHKKIDIISTFIHLFSFSISTVSHNTEWFSNYKHLSERYITIIKQRKEIEKQYCIKVLTKKTQVAISSGIGQHVASFI
jgi:hypothetical protein